MLKHAHNIYFLTSLTSKGPTLKDQSTFVHRRFDQAIIRLSFGEDLPQMISKSLRLTTAHFVGRKKSLGAATFEISPTAYQALNTAWNRCIKGRLPKADFPLIGGWTCALAHQPKCLACTRVKALLPPGPMLTSCYLTRTALMQFLPILTT